MPVSCAFTAAMATSDGSCRRKDASINQLSDDVVPASNIARFLIFSV
jgi:hypothetical protein